MDSTRHRRTAFAVAVGVLALVAAACIPTAQKPPPPPPGPPVITATCGMTITTDVVIGNDLTCSRDALIVGADGITIDLGGHIISGVGSDAMNGVNGGSVFPVAVDAHTFTVEHGAITGFATAVSAQEQSGAGYPYGSHHVTVDGVHLVANLGVGLVGFTGNTITHSTFEPRAGDDNATGIGGSFRGDGAGDRIAFNTFKNVATGVSAFDFGNSKIDQNTFSAVRTGVSVARIGGIDITGNHMTGSGGLPADGSNGVWLSDGVTQVKVAGNDITGLQVGVRLVGGGLGLGAVTVSANTLHQNGAAGVTMVGDHQDGITIDHNSVSGNGFSPGNMTNAPLGTAVIDDGIYVDVTQGTVTLTANHADGNTGHGIVAIGATDGGNNTATLNHTAPQCAGVAC
jgi:Right handed beta helix region